MNYAEIFKITPIIYVKDVYKKELKTCVLMKEERMPCNKRKITWQYMHPSNKNMNSFNSDPCKRSNVEE
jgi:hypothetical protein